MYSISHYECTTIGVVYMAIGCNYGELLACCGSVKSKLGVCSG